MFEAVSIFFGNAAQIWNAQTLEHMLALWQMHIMWTMMACMPFYILFMGPQVFGIKHEFLTKGLKYTGTGNIVLAVLPLVIPIALTLVMMRVSWDLLVGACRRWYPVQNASQRNRP